MKVLKTVEGLLKAKAIRNPPAWLLAAKQYQPLPRPPKPNELPRHPSQKLLAHLKKERPGLVFSLNEQDRLPVLYRRMLYEAELLKPFGFSETTLASMALTRARDWYQHARDQAQMQRISVSFAPPSDEEGAEAGATASPVDEAASQTASAKTAPSASSAQSTSASNDDLSSLLDDLMPPSRPSASSDSTQWDVPRRS